MTKLYLVRHAEADGNIYRRVHGHYDSYITPNGYRQIEALRERFQEIPIDAVYASDLFRTQTTAKAIYEDRNIPFKTSSDFREISLGCWEDLTWGELICDYPLEYDAWSHHPEHFSIKGGETHEEVFLRFKKALDAIVQAHPNQSVAIVSHGAAIRDVLCGLMYGDMTHLNEIGWCDNTAISLITADDHCNYHIEYCNDNAHLQALSTLKKQRWWREEDDPALHNLRFDIAQLPRDLNKCLDYYRRAWLEIFRLPDYDVRASTSHTKHLYSINPQAIAFGYRKDDEIGTIMLDCETRLCPSGGHISLLFLEEPYRSQGFGIQFLGYAASLFRRLSRKYLTVRVASTNAHALAFYEKHGFLEFGRENSGDILQILMRKPIYFEI